MPPRKASSSSKRKSDESKKRKHSEAEEKNKKRKSEESASEASTEEDNQTTSEDESTTRRKTRSSTSTTSSSKPKRRPISKKEKPVEEDEEEYEVETLLLKREKHGKTQYLVKWQHWPIKDSSWEPISNLTKIPEMISKFDTLIYKTLNSDYKEGRCRFVPDKILDSRQAKKKVEYLTKWKDFPVNTWEPEKYTSGTLISKYNKKNLKTKKVIMGKSSKRQESEESSSDSMSQCIVEEPLGGADLEGEEATVKSKESPVPLISPPEPSQRESTIMTSPTNGITEDSDKGKLISAEELDGMQFKITQIKKKNNSILMVIQEEESKEKHICEVEVLRSHPDHVQKLVDFLLGKIVFEKKK